MKSEFNLLVKVGRAEPRPVGTFSSDAHADAAQGAQLLDLQKSGVCPSRVEFSRVPVAGSAPAPKKGKK